MIDVNGTFHGAAIDSREKSRREACRGYEDFLQVAGYRRQVPILVLFDN